jgi:hypothetical protein
MTCRYHNRVKGGYYCRWFGTSVGKECAATAMATATPSRRASSATSPSTRTLSRAPSVRTLPGRHGASCPRQRCHNV